MASRSSSAGTFIVGRSGRSAVVSIGADLAARLAGSAAIAVAVFCAGAPAAALQRVYVANIEAGTVAVLDADRRVVLGVIATGAAPNGLAVSPDGAAIYVANFGSDSVSVIDTATDTIRASVEVGAGPVGIAAGPDGAVYVANKNDGTVSVIDPAAGAVVATIAIGAGEGPNAVALTPDGARALVTSSLRDSVAVIDTVQRRVVQTLRVGAAPNRVAVSPDGARAYVTTFRDGELAVIDLRSLTVVAGPRIGQATGIAIGPDGRSVYVLSGGVLRIDTASLAIDGHASIGGVAYGIAPLPSGTILVANMTLDEIAFLPARLGPYPPSYTPSPSPARVSVFGGPFALVALPSRETPALTISIDDPPFDFKLDRQGSSEVRISVGDGTAELARWSLRLRALDGSISDRLLAAGKDALDRSSVVTLDGNALDPGIYELELEALANSQKRLTRRLRFTVPDRRYALVPLEPLRSRDASLFAMDATGQRFVRSSGFGDVVVDDVQSGVHQAVNTPIAIDRIDVLQLSGDGMRLAMATSRAFGLLDLDSGLFSVLPYYPSYFDIDAAGRWLAGTGLVFQRDRYQLFDTVAGSRLRLSDVDPIDDPPGLCRLFQGNRPLLSADGDTVVFATGLDLGFAEANGCNVFAYDRPSGSFRLVVALGETQLDQPSLDDAGTTMGLILGLDLLGSYRGARATLIDLATGALRDVLRDRPGSSYDAALTADGRDVVISSCADLDPSVGNIDRNQELFVYDTVADGFRQITDTRGGLIGCSARDGRPFGPQVNDDGTVVAFALNRVRTRHLQRSLRNSLGFAAARAVTVDPDNLPPALIAPAAERLRPGDGLRFTVTATDPDGDPIVFFADFDDLAGLPPNAEFRPGNEERAEYRFSWYVYDSIWFGEHILRIGAFDGRGGEAVSEVRLTVCPIYPEPNDVDAVITSIFTLPAPACGSADSNGDGMVTAADLLAARAARAVAACPDASHFPEKARASRSTSSACVAGSTSS